MPRLCPLCQDLHLKKDLDSSPEVSARLLWTPSLLLHLPHLASAKSQSPTGLTSVPAMDRMGPECLQLLPSDPGHGWQVERPVLQTLHRDGRGSFEFHVMGHVCTEKRERFSPGKHLMSSKHIPDQGCALPQTSHNRKG